MRSYLGILPEGRSSAFRSDTSKNPYRRHVDFNQSKGLARAEIAIREVFRGVRSRRSTGQACGLVHGFVSGRSIFVGAMPSGIDYGGTNQEALIGAVAEIYADLTPWLVVLPRRKERGSCRSLALTFGPTFVADSLTLCLRAGSPVGRDTVLEWITAIRAHIGESIWVLLDVAVTDYFELIEGYKPFMNFNTSQLGAVPGIELALGHSLIALLQRDDGNGLLVRLLHQGVVLNLSDGLGSERRNMHARSARGTRDQGTAEICHRLVGLTNFYVVGHDIDPADASTPTALLAYGEACDSDCERTIRKALLEFRAARVQGDIRA